MLKAPPSIDTIREFLPGTLNGLAALLSVGPSLFSQLHFNVQVSVARAAGGITIAAGLLLAGWATAHIRSSILAEVSPRLPALKQSGPYRSVRHPESVS
jgi:protein-S-isoprenylcysteine O-methyltransferase Ste14